MYYQHYIQAHDNYFWQWEENESVIGIPKSSTIAYRPVVAKILKGLAKGGLPPFGSILLALIATNEQMPENSLGEIGELMEESITENHLIDGSPIIQHLQIMGEAIQFLQLLQKLPGNYKSQEGRIILFRCIFEQMHYKESIANSEIIAERFADASTYILNNDKKDSAHYNSAAFLRDFRNLGLLLQRFPTTESIIEQVGELPEVNDLNKILDEEKEIYTDATELDFIEELIEDDRSFHIGALIRTFWAGLKIPVNNAIPSDQKYGGVADLTNKGDFDKLLLSEFANEDIVLLSRLANNEALYFNKETPPIENAFQRIILVDVSIKNWGTAKTLIHAIGLAIAKHPKSGEDCQVFALGKSFVPILYNSVGEVVQALQEVDIALHCAEGLTAFLENFVSDKSLELFFISSPDTLKLPAMQRVMQECRSRIRYWIQANALGQIDFYKNLNGGKKHLQQLQLNLEELWKPRPKRKKKKQSEEDVEFPCFYPILYPVQTNPKQVLVMSTDKLANYRQLRTPDTEFDVLEVYYVTSEKHLLRIGSPHSPWEKGAQLIVDKTVPHTEAAAGRMSDGSEYILFFNMQNRKITLLNLSTKTMTEVIFNEWESSTYNSFIFYDDAFHYIIHYNLHPWRIDPVTGEITRHIQDKTTLAGIYTRLKAWEKLISSKIFRPISILKNIHALSINSEGNLVFNSKHELMINQQGVFKIDLGRNSPVAKAQGTPYGFIFEEGSKVFIDRAGILILESSDKSLQKIYIPLVLDAALGVATDDSFSGYEYFLPKNSTLKKLYSLGMYQNVLKAFTKVIELKLR